MGNPVVCPHSADEFMKQNCGAYFGNRLLLPSELTFQERTDGPKPLTKGRGGTKGLCQALTWLWPYENAQARHKDI